MTAQSGYVGETTVGEFIDSLPGSAILTGEQKLTVYIGITFCGLRDVYGIPLICFHDARAVSGFVSLLRTAGYRGDIPLCC